MKVSRPSKNQLVFQLGKREKNLLLNVLKLYPLVPVAHHTLTKSGQLPDQEASEHLLEEAVREQREQNRKQLQVFLSDPSKVVHVDHGCRLHMTPAEADWLLQVLNDLRVGSWIRLGCPEKQIHRLTAKTARDVWTMEIAGYFEMHLLEALTGPE